MAIEYHSITASQEPNPPLDSISCASWAASPHDTNLTSCPVTLEMASAICAKVVCSPEMECTPAVAVGSVANRAVKAAVSSTVVRSKGSLPVPKKPTVPDSMSTIPGTDGSSIRSMNPPLRTWSTSRSSPDNAAAARLRASNCGGPAGALNRSIAKVEGTNLRAPLATAAVASATWPSRITSSSLQRRDDDIDVAGGLRKRVGIQHVSDGDDRALLDQRINTSCFDGVVVPPVLGEEADADIVSVQEVGGDRRSEHAGGAGDENGGHDGLLDEFGRAYKYRYASVPYRIPMTSHPVNTAESPGGSGPESKRRAPGRPRDAAVESALLAAAQDLLVQVGYERMSLEAVASRAGASKAAIYRRWAGKPELVAAAVQQLYPPPQVPDTGSLREDLLACARAYLGREPRTQRILTVLIAEMVSSPALRTAARDAIGAPHGTLFATVLSRTQDQGNIAAAVDVDLVAQIFPSMAFRRVGIDEIPVDEAFVSGVVDGCLLPALGLH